MVVGNGGTNTIGTYVASAIANKTYYTVEPCVNAAKPKEVIGRSHEVTLGKSVGNGLSTQTNSRRSIQGHRRVERELGSTGRTGDGRLRKKSSRWLTL